MSYGTVNNPATVDELRQRLAVAEAALREKADIETALRASEERQAFLLKLNDALRTPQGEVAISTLALEMLAERLDVECCYIARINIPEDRADIPYQFVRHGFPHMPASLRLSSFPESLRPTYERTQVLGNAAEDPNLTQAEKQALAAVNIGSLVAATLRCGERTPFWTLVAASSQARHWTPADVALIQGVSEQVWAASQRAQGEAALRESEARYRGLLNASNQVLYRQNPSWSEMRQLSGGGFLEDTQSPDADWFDRYIHPDDQPHVWAAIQQSIRTKTMFELEHRVFRADGTLGWTLSRSTPVFDANGEIIEWFGAASDVTARREAEAALSESETRFRQFANASSGILWIRDAATLRLEFVSSGFAAIYGDSSDLLLKDNDIRHWARLILPEDRKAALDAFRRVRRSERITYEFRIRRPVDGVITWLRNTDFPLLTEHGQVRHVAGIAQDVTAEKQAVLSMRDLNADLERRVEERTNELMAAEASLRQAQKMDAVGQLASGIAHDFNNMLQGIGGSLELMRRRMEQGRLAETSRHIDNARDTVRRAAALTHRLLAFSRQQKLAPTRVNLDELVDGMTDMIQRTVGASVQIEVRLGSGKWSVLCDGSQLENALLNLCVNARDAMPEGGWLTILTANMELTAADLAGEEDLAAGPYVAVSVTDTGTGMPPEVVARVFEPFYTTKPLGQGTGLGLSQVYGFVHQSGGLVRVESTPGQGTTIRLILPRWVAADDAPDADTAEKVVLLVEDDDGSREITGEWLREAGYRVLEAPDGAGALRLLHSSGRVDILVTDVGLPGMNGRQVADAARMERPGLPVLFITGYAGTALRDGMPEGMAIIDKPFALDELATRIRAMLETP